jgi:hypothetical protein
VRRHSIGLASGHATTRAAAFTGRNMLSTVTAVDPGLTARSDQRLAAVANGPAGPSSVYARPRPGTPLRKHSFSAMPVPKSANESPAMTAPALSFYSTRSFVLAARVRLDPSRQPSRSLCQRVGARNVVDQLDAAHITWKAYVEDMPKPCFRGYSRKHNPFASDDDVAGDPALAANVRLQLARP